MGKVENLEAIKEWFKNSNIMMTFQHYKLVSDSKLKRRLSKWDYEMSKILFGRRFYTKRGKKRRGKEFRWLGYIEVKDGKKHFHLMGFIHPDLEMKVEDHAQTVWEGIVGLNGKDDNPLLHHQPIKIGGVDRVLGYIAKDSGEGSEFIMSEMVR
jgi:hypothetical protein